MKFALAPLGLLVVVAGCQTTAAPANDAPPNAPPAAKPAPPAPVAAKPGEPTKVDLVDGKEVKFGSDVTMLLKHVMYAHLEGGRNSSMLELTVTRAGKTETVTLVRESPGEPKFTKVMGMQVAIDYVDAYHQPATAAVLVKAE